MVDEQHAVEMVDLVLDAGGEQAVGVHFLHLAITVEVAHAHAAGPLDVTVIIGDRQAAFLVDIQLFRRPDNLRIGDEQGLRLLVLARHVEDQNALGDRHLDRRQPDAGRVVHGLHHVVHELAHRRVDMRHRLGNQLEARIGYLDDGQDGHGSLGFENALACAGDKRAAVWGQSRRNVHFMFESGREVC